MATDVPAIIRNLLDFYDFGDKTILAVGAGGGQLMEYAHQARHVHAIDNDAKAIADLKCEIERRGWLSKYSVHAQDFFNVELLGDVVLFEFSLHEMRDADLALEHAKALATEVVVLDHGPSSRWAYTVSEEALVARAWEAAKRFGIRRYLEVDTVQIFGTYAELREKVECQGETSIERIVRYSECKSISIPMTYALATLSAGGQSR